jgi:L-ectoine synthase
MKVVSVNDTKGTAREVWCPDQAFVSFRLLLAEDGMGFSLHKTVLPAGGPHRWHYKHHKEACYCIKGEGVLTSESTGERFAIYRDVCYVLDKNDPHTLEVMDDMELLSVFNPPCTGSEVHRDDGSYAP